MPQSLSSVTLHVVFSTKHRYPLIPSRIRPELHRVMAGILHSSRSRLLSAGGMPDHQHLLVSLDRSMSVSQTLREIKSNSSHWIHRSCPRLRRFAWQGGYSAFSVSHSQIGQLKNYLEHQGQHHRTMTFKEELCALLKSHRVEFDERYLWD